MSRSVLVPVILLAGLGALALGSKAKAAEPQPPAPPVPVPPLPPPVTPPIVPVTPPAPPKPAAPPTFAYVDSNSVRWIVANPSPGVWTGMLAVAPPHPIYASGLPFVRSTREQVNQAIDERAMQAAPYMTGG